MILAIDTSCDETSAAVTDGRKVLSNVISSQIDIHKKYGGVFPALAKRAHQERIDFVVKEALKRALKCFKSEYRISKYEMVRQAHHLERSRKTNSNFQNKKFSNVSDFVLRASNLPLEAVAVTQGPGLAIALEVGIKKAKEIINSLQSNSYRLIPKLIAVNHLEGHIYSCLGENSKGLPHRNFILPALCLIVSGGHTELVVMKEHGKYEVIGATLDDACGEALDKATKILKLGYPGGPVIEKLSEQFLSKSKIKKHCASQQKSKFILSQPLREKTNLNFSYSGLKTQFLYLVEKMTDKELGKNLHNLAFSFQEACFGQIIRKTSQAIKIHQPKTLVCGGGVIANKYLRKLLRRVAKENHLRVFFPTNKNLTGDNAAMIGVAAHYKYLRNEFVENIEGLDREPRLSL